MANKINKNTGFLKNRLREFANTRQFLGSLIPASQKVYSLGKKEFNNWLADARVKIKNPANTNVELGHYFYKAGKISDALFRYKLANFINHNTENLYFIGKAYYSLDKVKQATNYLQDYYKSVPDSKEALYFLSLIDKEYKSTPPTNNLIKENFDIFADYFTKFYIENIDYTGDVKICEAFFKEIEGKSKHLNILDLGCSNGHIGAKIKEAVEEISLTGLDFSANMIKNCQELEYRPLAAQKNETEIIQNVIIDTSVKKTYDILVNDDFFHYVETKKPKYQYIVSRGIINYITSTSEFFAYCAKCLDKNGKLFFYKQENVAFDVEEKLKTERHYPYYLAPINHTHENIIEGVKKAKMKIISSTEFVLEKDVKATLYIVEKN